MSSIERHLDADDPWLARKQTESVEESGGAPAPSQDNESSPEPTNDTSGSETHYTNAV